MRMKSSDLGDFIDELLAGSERAVVVIAAALDELLRQILTKYFLPSPTKDDRLFESDGPLATFSSRTRLIRRLGLIDAETAEALTLIRKIRNDFAHKFEGCRLDIGANKDRTKRLCTGVKSTRVSETLKQMFSDNDQPEILADFSTRVCQLVNHLAAVRSQVRRVTPAAVPDDDDE